MFLFTIIHIRIVRVFVQSGAVSAVGRFVNTDGQLRDSLSGACFSDEVRGVELGDLLPRMRDRIVEDDRLLQDSDDPSVREQRKQAPPVLGRALLHRPGHPLTVNCFELITENNDCHKNVEVVSRKRSFGKIK
jgi:hypothetical protein